MSKQKILITGSGGFVFSNFIRKAIYEKKPYDFVSIDRVNKSSVLNNIYNNKNHTFYIGDVADNHFVNVIFEYERPDIILHGAAETSTEDSLKDPNKFIRSNVLGTQTLINAAVKWGVKNFVYVSTDKVYGQLENENLEAWKETNQINPRNFYSVSKASGELIVKAANQSYGLNYCIARSCNNYGPWQTADKFIPKVVKCIIENQKIPVFDQGLQMRDWIHVFDNCSALMKVLENGQSGETYNISANQEFSNIEVVNEICKIIGKGYDLISFVKDKPNSDFRRSIDSSKLRTLGWEPKFKFRSGLAQVVDWYVANKFFLK